MSSIKHYKKRILQQHCLPDNLSPPVASEAPAYAVWGMHTLAVSFPMTNDCKHILPQMVIEETRWRPWIDKSPSSATIISHHQPLQLPKSPLNLSLREQMTPVEQPGNNNKTCPSVDVLRKTINNKAGGRKPLDLSVKKSYLLDNNNNNSKKADDEQPQQNVAEEKTEEPAFMSEPPKLRLIKDVLAQGIKLVGRVHPHPTLIARKRPVSMPPPVAPPKHPKTMKIVLKKPLSTAASSTTSSHQSKVPKGKLGYIKEKHSFLRYFHEAQKDLYVKSVLCKGVNPPQGVQVIKLPPQVVLSEKDNISVEEYVVEMINVEKYIPRDYFLFYKFVTGYQICNNNLPVSFLMFLKLFSTNGLKNLLAKYVGKLT